MQAFFSDEQLLHEPRQFMRLGRISAPTDLPSRAGSLQAALAARGIAVQAPPDFGREPLLAVHSADYLTIWNTPTPAGGLEGPAWIPARKCCPTCRPT